MNCPRCVHENGLGARFCNECGRLVYAEMGATGQVARLADENPM